MRRAHRDCVAAARLQRRRRARRRARSRAALLGLVAVGAVAGSAAIETMSTDEEAGRATLAVAATESPDSGAPDQPEATPDEEPREVAPTPASYQLYLDRDPFESVVPEPTPSGGGGSSDDEGSVAGDRPSFSSDPDDDDDGAADDEDAADDHDLPSTGSLCTGGPVELVCAGRVVTLESIGNLDGEQAADVRVDTAVHTARPGEVFADDFMLGRIGDGSVMLAFRGEVHELQVEGAIK